MINEISGPEEVMDGGWAVRLGLVMRFHERGIAAMASSRSVEDRRGLPGDAGPVTFMFDRLLRIGHLLPCGRRGRWAVPSLPG